MNTVWRIRDVYPGSRILIFTHPGSQISDPGSKNIYIIFVLREGDGRREFDNCLYNICLGFQHLRCRTEPGEPAERLHASGARQVSTGIRMTRKKVREVTQGRYGGWVGGRRVDPY